MTSGQLLRLSVLSVSSAEMGKSIIIVLNSSCSEGPRSGIYICQLLWTMPDIQVAATSVFAINFLSTTAAAIEVGDQRGSCLT